MILDYTSTSISIGDIQKQNRPSFKQSPCICIYMYFFIQQRDGVLNKFLDGYCDILVATDIASRGLDTINVSIFKL